MIIDDLLRERNMTRYRLAVTAGIPHATLNDICSGKTRLEKCSAETVYKLAKALGVSMELLTGSGIRQVLLYIPDTMKFLEPHLSMLFLLVRSFLKDVRHLDETGFSGS